MPRTIEIDLELDVPPDEFWKLRMDTGFDEYIAECDKQIFTLDSLSHHSDASGEVFFSRTTRLLCQENPVPGPFRRFLTEPEFAFHVTSKWHHRLWGRDHPMVYSTLVPVFKDRIKIEGKQWLEPTHGGTSCKLCIRVEFKASVFGFGSQIEHR